MTLKITMLAAVLLFSATAHAKPVVTVPRADDVSLAGQGADALYLYAGNAHARGGTNSSVFSSGFPADPGHPWSRLASFEGNGSAIGVLDGTSFSISFAQDSTQQRGTWNIMDLGPKDVTLDLAFAMYASNNNAAFFFDDQSLISRAMTSGTWTITWPNPGGNTSSFSSLAVFGRNVRILSPIPEAHTYAMLLAGLGVVGFMGRRRKSG